MPARSLASAGAPCGEVHAVDATGARDAGARRGRRAALRRGVRLVGALARGLRPGRRLRLAAAPLRRDAAAARRASPRRASEREERRGDEERDAQRRARDGGRGDASRCGGGNSRSNDGRESQPEIGERSLAWANRADRRLSEDTSGRHTLRMMPRRCSSEQDPEPDQHEASANASDAFTGESHEAKSVR